MCDINMISLYLSLGKIPNDNSHNITEHDEKLRKLTHIPFSHQTPFLNANEVQVQVY